MTEPSQYFKGRTVQEQMDEVIGYVDTRAAEVATTAIASDVAQVHQDMLDADADAQAAAASAAAAAGTLANAVKKTGEASQSIAGNIAVVGTLSGGVVTGTTVTVPTPVNNTDAANKKFVSDSLDNYATMVRTANAQTIGGIKTHTDNIVISKTNGRLSIADTRDISVMTSSNVAGGMNISVKNGGSDMTLVADEVRVSGFGVTGGVERMMWTYCKMPDDSIKSIILRVRIDPSTGKAQLLFGSNVISEVNL